MQQNAGTVTGERIGAHRAAVVQIVQDLQPLLEDAVTGAVFDIDDETDAAGIMLGARVVQTRAGRKAVSAQAGKPCKSVVITARLGSKAASGRLAAGFGEPLGEGWVPARWCAAEQRVGPRWNQCLYPGPVLGGELQVKKGKYISFFSI